MEKPHELIAVANKDGTISLALGPGIRNNLGPQEAIKFALTILQSVQNASYEAGFKPSELRLESEELKNVIGITPDAIGGTGPDKSIPASLVVCIGPGRFALGMEPQQLAALSQILQTMSAPEGRKN